MGNEFARQVFHFVSAGALAVLAAALSQPWFVLVCASLLLVSAVLVYVRPPFVRRALGVLDREHVAIRRAVRYPDDVDRVVPIAAAAMVWRGATRTGAALFAFAMATALVVGLLLHFVVESPDQLVPALAVLAVADAAATLVGVHLGRHTVPWSPYKTWEGVAGFFVSAAGVLAFFSSSWLLVAACATVIDSADYTDFVFLDDNVLIPLTVGAALLL